MITTKENAIAAGAFGEVQVRVFHNNHAREKYLSGYESGQSVTEVFAYATAAPKGEAGDLATDLAVAEEAFELFNIGDDPEFGTPDPRAEDYRTRRNRSLSVGDVIAIDERFYSCDAGDWRALPEQPPIEQRAAYGTTPLY